MVFHWGLSDSKSPQAPKSLILSYSLVTVAKTPITVCITVTFMFHSFFQFSSKVPVLILLFVFFQFYPEVRRESKVHNSASYLFIIDYYLVWSSTLYDFSHNHWCWSFTGIWVTPYIVGSPGLVWLFWQFSTMLWSGWSRFFILFPILLVPFLSF